MITTPLFIPLPPLRCFCNGVSSVHMSVLLNPRYNHLAGASFVWFPLLLSFFSSDEHQQLLIYIEGSDGRRCACCRRLARARTRTPIACTKLGTGDHARAALSCVSVSVWFIFVGAKVHVTFFCIKLTSILYTFLYEHLLFSVLSTPYWN